MILWGNIAWCLLLTIAAVYVSMLLPDHVFLVAWIGGLLVGGIPIHRKTIRREVVRIKRNVD